MSKVVYLGDSLTANFKKLNELENVVNMGIGGDKTLEVIGRLKFVNQQKPDKLFLLVGINDYLCNQWTWAHGLIIKFFKTYDAILDILKTNLPQTKFYVLAIFPVNTGSVVPVERLTRYNQEIDEWNVFVKYKAKEYGMEFLDLSNHFKDEFNNLRKEYTLDGIHLNELGYEVYYNLIKELLE
ncbi:MAG: Lipolytic protein family [Haloplasmataceae bacterium]|nr:Lipolytic protein family [Haloplasmataceae bacterium]